MAQGRFVSYLRVSTDKQGRSGLGLDAQREAVMRYLNGGSWSLIEEFVETESGRKNNRVQLAAALAACRVHRATLVIAKLDRLARNASFLMGLIDSNVDVVFCDLPEVPAGSTGRFMLQQMAAVAELEAGLISERTKAALRAKVARDGQWDRKASHHLVAGAGQAAAVAARKASADQRAADLAPYLKALQSEGAASLRQLAAALNARDVPSPSGGQWSAVGVKRVLDRL
ncbi:recombinase family protein [uncultured Alsobacter sp.]|uniref:recombinase family protein n=1 Tax=uncultured Alsobacter sp. TaxID=1748258 RepID=UPI0025E5A6C5|nr:recombinase family protein [uncultured Alsobacter sp.]